MALLRWMYRGGRPNRLAKFLNGISAFLHMRGLQPNYLVTLEVVGRSSGRPVRFPLVMVAQDGERYLVAMLGAETNWVRNLRAAGGAAALHHGRVELIRLEEVAVEQRAPILRVFVQRAPGARPHMQIAPDAPLAEYEAAAAQYPVFRVIPRAG
jgi:F420H(2)-dependent quinone reductase